MEIKLKPVSTIEMNLGLEQYGPGHKYFAERCRERMNARYVPEDTGVLINTSYIDDECNIHYIQHYAGYQYYGQRKDGTHKVSNYTKIGTGPYWDKLMMSAEGNELKQDMQDWIDGKVNK